ncbi:chain-length determining protein [Marinobacter xiaoshiensis]|uniref:Chain-length determining protein n=1 Tax=Marinobacter xiaoshiensis TaxID=3073652 RepID=A0ABU2HEJ4_9GAMM|nr:chain-length determining protein [Marinobacter sp. F60267]MDS1309449.1 chain-length determining protein [Marinobacter sp. F60267]
MIQFCKRNPFWVVAAMATLLAIIYWGLMATDRYVSRAHIVLQTPEIVPSGLNVSSLLSGTSGSGDLLLLKDHLESVVMLKTLQKRLDLRGHYAQADIDVFSRFSNESAPIEKFHGYMQKRINILFDDYSSVLKIEVQAYTPEMAQKIVEALLEEGERHMNRMGQRLAAEQVDFIDKQAQALEARLFEARDAMLSYQNQHGLVAPTQTIEAIFTTVSRLESELAVLRARTAAQSSYQSASSPEIRRLKAEIQSIEEQIDIEKEKMARQGGDALNKVSAEYETLQMRAQFALELYSSALTTLETTRVEAARKLKQVSVLEFPTLPEYPIKPDRTYNIIVFGIFAILFAAIMQMVMAVIRDHSD